MIGPEDLQGHWHRAWLKAPGISDHDTSVHWMQAGTLYADIRVPANRPDLRGAGALADLSDATLLTLLRAEGFAGTISVAEDICTWARHINWHGAPACVDSGHMRFEAPHRLVETGVHADYAELWNRRVDQPVSAIHMMAGQAHAFLVTVGKRFVFGTGTPGAVSSDDMISALRSGHRSRALHSHFDHVFALGRWDGLHGLAHLCTNPLLEGQRLVSCTAQGDLIWHAVDFFGKSRDVPLKDAVSQHHNAA
jgi:hypothetical protein